MSGFVVPSPVVKLPDCQINWEQLQVALGDRFNFQVVIDQAGPLTVSGSYQASGGQVFALFMGSGLVTSTFSFNGVDLFVNGALVSQSYVGFNEPNSHRATIPAFWVGGRRTDNISFQLRAGTPGGIVFQTDVNDHFRLAVLEIP